MCSSNILKINMNQAVKFVRRGERSFLLTVLCCCKDWCLLHPGLTHLLVCYANFPFQVLMEPF